MKFVVRNQADIANKYIRFAKWKIRKLSRKFGDLIYSEIYINEISYSPKVYSVTVKMGVPGPDIIVSSKSNNLNQLWAELSMKMKRQLRKNSSKNRLIRNKF